MMPIFLDENEARGIPGTSFEAGISNTDTTGFRPETGVTLPWVLDPEFTYLDYLNELWIELDSGMVLHKTLPQEDVDYDTLATQFLIEKGPGGQLSGDREPEKSVKGPFTVSKGKYTDTIQRMATSTYRFGLKGYGLRIGYQLPVPGLKYVAGVTAVPDEKQVSVQAILANYSGIPLWGARWELWYVVALPPSAAALAAPNLAQHIGPQAKPPREVQAPWSQPDTNAVASSPPLQRVFRP